MISFHINKQLQSAAGQMMLDVECHINKGELATIYGVSGAGKTTILRILAGLLLPEKGIIQIGDETWLDTERKINLPPQKRNIGFVFQHYALFPNMTVRGNLAYAMQKGQPESIIDELLTMMDLELLQSRYPHNLSGGQQQRVALARALVRKPKILLLDEPLSALDTEMRLKLQDQILNINKAYKLTTILVSHDKDEILKLSDKVFLLEGGRINSSGKPDLLFPSTGIEAGFSPIGEVVSVVDLGNGFLVSISIMNQVFELKVPREEIGKYRVGCKVGVSSL